MILDKEPCCLDRKPVAAASQVRQIPGSPAAGPTIEYCNPNQILGRFNETLAIDNLASGNVGFFPDASEGDGTTAGQNGRPFGGFPWAVDTPQTGGLSGYGFNFEHSQTEPAGVDFSCPGSGVESFVLFLTLQQNVDQDPDANDSADGFLGIELAGVAVSTTGNVISGSASTQGFAFGGAPNSIWAVQPLGNDQDIVMSISLDNPASYTLAEIYAMTAGLTLEVNGSYIIQDMRFELQYYISDACSPKAVLTKSCPTDVSATSDDVEVISSGWICDPATDTYQRTITPYINGVAQPDQVIDSGVPCSEQPPAERELSQVELCVANEVQVQFYESVDGAAPAPLGALIPTGKECGDRVLVDSGQSLAEGTAGQTFQASAAVVRTWALSVRGPDPITVTFSDGSTVVVESGDSISFGNGEDTRSTAGITFATGADSRGLLTYEI